MLYAMLLGSIIAVYRAPPFINQLFFAVVLICFAVSRRNAIFFAFAFCIVSRVGNLFTGLLASGQNVATYHLIGFIDVTFIDLFLAIAIVKALKRQGAGPFLFVKPVTWLAAYLLMMFMVSMVVEPLGLGELARELRRLFTFSLLFSMPRLLPSASDFRRFAVVLMPMIVVLAAAQLYRFHTGEPLEPMLSGSDYPSEMKLSIMPSRLTISMFEAFLFCLYGFALFYWQRSAGVLPRAVFGLLALLAMLVAVASGTRIWMVSYVVIWIGVAVVAQRSHLERFLMLGGLVVGALFMVMGDSRDETVSFIHDRVNSAMVYGQGQAAVADSSIDVRLHDKLPKLLGGIGGSPLFGYGFTSGFYLHEDSDLGALNTVLQSGVLGLLLFINLWWAVLSVLLNRSGLGASGTRMANRALQVFCAGAIMVDMSTISITGFHLPSSRIFFLVTLLCFIAENVGCREAARAKVVPSWGTSVAEDLPATRLRAS